MAYRFVREEAASGFYNYHCYGCGQLTTSSHYYSVYSASDFHSCYDHCDECIKDVDVVYDYYLEVYTGMHLYTYHDVETARYQHPLQFPRPVKI